mmetsp:Transcript_2612/g.3860  ORF Transcript_2612/g.3860 Transcript_2612/m.3860 type:complete len:355 (+) Transcript_2612:78-1142(+)|eukprot:CAMPEP_0194207814 /NCGR_PEP_ID=MMETSP0156-20130528/6453_1 /TAXON_ID=33649 /ORGANISM="Thalassionema nitzschioides, Strain L26-B" /LENGTH=354 /DNA_ID=CAMNT_0038934669 /DNA_START=29 /DNA_END=1093 /DNA_ORIENTATION=+
MKLFTIATTSSSSFIILLLLAKSGSGFQVPPSLLAHTSRLCPSPLSPPCRRRMQFPLQISDEKDDDDGDSTNNKNDEAKNDNDAPTAATDTALERKIAGRKKRVVAGYTIMTAGYSLYSLLLLTLARAPLYNVSGPLMTAGISYIMKGAASAGRLASDTYKRLNLTLLGYGLITFTTEIGLTLGPLWLITNLVTIVNCIKGYGYGLKGWELQGETVAMFKDDIKSGLKSNVECMKQILKPNKISTGYWVATVISAFVMLQKGWELLVTMKCGLGMVDFARYFVMTNVLFTVKDASDRKRLEGTTFIQLNLMASLAMLSWASLGGSIGSILYALISGFLAVRGVSSIRTKQQQKQ